MVLHRQAPLRGALAAFPGRDEVEVVWRSFELDPGAPAFDPRTPPVPLLDRLGQRYGGGRAGALEMVRHVTGLAAAEGLTYDLERATSGSTRTAHRLLHAALAEGGPTLQGAVGERFMRGYFGERVHVADPDQLVPLAVEAGLAEDVAGRVAFSQEYWEAVDADIAQAHAYGITGVPFFVVDGRYGVSGAQPAELLAQVLERAA